MHLYIMRHGLAADVSPSGSDRDRPLTDEGRRNVEHIGGLLQAHHGGPLSRILSSTYIRAAQTADIMSRCVSGSVVGLDLHEELEPEEPTPTALLRDLVEHGTDALIVGHHPMVIAMLRMLVRDVGTLPLGLHPAMLVGVEHLKRETSPGRLDGAFRVATVFKP